MSTRPTKGTPTASVHHVACAIDNNMVYPLAVLVHSLQKHQSAPFRLTVGFLEGTLSIQNHEALQELLEDLGIEHSFLPFAMDTRFITQGHISPTTFAKFLLADAIASAHLWLDADTIALPGWDSIFDDINKARGTGSLVVAKRLPKGNPAKSPDDLPFNAGVLGWPQAKRREWSNALSSMPVVDTQEQYLFNALYSKDAHWVSERFNTLTYTLDQLPSTKKPHIIHYAGAHKPWHLVRPQSDRCVSYGCPWSEWFVAERHFLSDLKPPAIAIAERLRKEALRSGRVRWQRDHSGLIFLRLLRALGPLGFLVTRSLLVLKQWIPRGTHPLHAVRS